MKKHIILSTLSVLLAGLLVSVQARTWTTDQYKVEGEFESVESDGQTVRIKQVDGTSVQVQKTQLSQADQQYIDTQKKEENDTNPVKPSVDTVTDTQTSEHKAGDRMVKTINSVEFAFRWCPPGTFIMGAPKEEAHWSDETQHKVTLTKGFWMLETEISQKQWYIIMRTTIITETQPSIIKHPLYGVGVNYPMYYVDWNKCQEFCKKCTSLGLPVCLPTEAQWEYACRAGTTGPHSGNLADIAWYKDNSNDKTHPVGTQAANAWGLYDMLGNVSEWCEDWYSKETYRKDTTDPIGPSEGTHRVIRGGYWGNDDLFCRSASRSSCEPEGSMFTDFTLGFRVVLKDQ